MIHFYHIGTIGLHYYEMQLYYCKTIIKTISNHNFYILAVILDRWAQHNTPLFSANISIIYSPQWTYSSDCLIKKTCDISIALIERFLHCIEMLQGAKMRLHWVLPMRIVNTSQLFINRFIFSQFYFKPYTVLSVTSILRPYFV